MFTYCHRCWALNGLVRLEAGMESVDQAIRLDPTAKYQLMTRTVFLQALGRTEEARDMMRKTRKARPGEWLDI